MSEWISVKDRLPEVIWHENKNGRFFSSQQVFLLRRIAGDYFACSYGEWDQSCIPPAWRVWHEFADENGEADCETWIVDDVTHWMPLPKFPEIEDKHD